MGSEPRAGESLAVTPDLDGARLDHALVQLLPEVSRTRLKELILDGGVRIGDELCQRPSRAVVEGERIEVLEVERSRLRTGGAHSGQVEVLHEDEDLVVVSKPPGMVTHPSSVVRGETLSEWAVARYGELPTVQGEDRPGIVHRLDADTTGLVVLARRQAAAEALLEAFKARTVEKTYLALVHNVPRFDSDWIETPIGRSSKRSDRMSTVPEGEGMEAQTFYLTRERFNGGALVEVKPRTGRTHQIRVHLSSIEHPLIGDQVYRGRRGLHLARLPGAPRFERHALHAWKLSFPHPGLGETVEFEAELPPDFQTFLAWARGG